MSVGKILNIRFSFSLTIIFGIFLLTGCNTAKRLAEVGSEPAMATIKNPIQKHDYRPVTTPMPRTIKASYRPNSLWRNGAKAFFKDQRASRVGDILTVDISIKDSGAINNKTERDRSGSEDVKNPNLFGLETNYDNIFPDAIKPDQLIKLESKSSATGNGKINRDETIELVMPVLVTQQLPNGNLVVNGTQEMRINFEIREVQLRGIIRPEDISATNRIAYDKIAEARLSYGGRGHISDVQQARYGLQLIDIIAPY